MLFLGHIAASLLIADAADGDRTAAVAGNLLPDVTDKTLGWVLHVTPARWLAHGLLGFALVSLAAALFLDKRRWRGFVLGYAGHLVCDLWAGGRVPWLAPFQRQPRGKSRWGKRGLLVFLLPELVGAPIIWRLVARGRD